METRTDPARTGVTAGRIVGLLTTGIAFASLVSNQSTLYASMEPLLRTVGVGGVLPVSALFWGNAVLALTARYSFCYVVGSLIGVVYDWLDRPSLAFLCVVVTIVGLADGLFAVVDTRSVVIGGTYVLAWLLYLPLFAWLFEEGAEFDAASARRL